MEIKNKIRVDFLSISKNEAFARNVIACFALELNPSISQLTDIKTAVSEAVTNAIVHGYSKKEGYITLEAEIIGNSLHINVFDEGVGIKDVTLALQPFYTTKEAEERSGMGFTIMKSFMDEVNVVSELGKGTKVYMKKIFDTDVMVEDVIS